MSGRLLFMQREPGGQGFVDNVPQVIIGCLKNAENVGIYNTIRKTSQTCLAVVVQPSYTQSA